MFGGLPNDDGNKNNDAKDPKKESINERHNGRKHVDGVASEANLPA